MKNSLRIAAISFAAAIASSVAGIANAGLAVDFTSPGSQNNVSVWSLGFEFTVDTPVTATGLGTFDFDQDGLAGSQQVGLWDSGQNLLASTFVDNGDPLQGFWRFHSITPVNLGVGTYFVASQGGEGYTFFTVGLSVDPNITFVQDAYHFNDNSSNSPLAFPDTTDLIGAGSGGGFFGGNVEFGTANVPEPATLALLGLGLAGLGFSRRRKQ